MSTATTQQIDAALVRKAIGCIASPGQVIEIRLLDTSRFDKDWPHTASGYFTNIDKLLLQLQQAGEARGTYMVLNPVNPNLLARANNRIRHDKNLKTTEDVDVTARHWLPIDTDPERSPKDIPATDEEHAAAIDRAYDIRAFLSDAGWPDPIYADSGNGGHLLYLIDLPVEDGGLVQRVLAALAQLFDTAEVKIDQRNYNPARLWKLYGTWARKGDDSPDIGRPQRMAKLLEVPEQLEPVPRSMLQELADMAPAKESTQPQAPPERQGVPSYLETFLSKHEISTRPRTSYKGGGRYLLQQCPFCLERDHNACVYETADGALGFSCSHNRCKDKHWQEFRQHFEPDAYTRKEQYQEYRPGPAPPTNGHKAEESAPLTFLEFTDLRTLPAPEWGIYRFLPTKGVNFLYGPAGEGKTYTAISLNVAVASEDIPWAGLATRHGHCIYIAAEDIDEVAQRFIGCATYHRLDDIPHLHIFPAPLQLVRDTPKLIESIKQTYGDTDIAMITIDTLAMCSLGIEENSKKEFDAVTSSLELLWRTFDCCVVAVHHTGRNGEIRGTSSMDGVAYSMIKVTKSDESVMLHSTKMRRGKAFDDFYLDWASVDVPGAEDEMGEQVTTGVLIRSDRSATTTPDRLTKLQKDILEHLHNLGGQNVARSDLKSACMIDLGKNSSFCNAVSALIGKGRITMLKQRQRTYYSIVDADEET